MLVKCETKSNRVKGLSFHPKLSWILASLHNGTIQLWDYRIGTLIDKFEEHEGGPVRGVCFHLNQPLFVSGGDDYKIKVWNYKMRRCIFTLLGHLDYIRTVQFHDEYPWIVSASDDQTIRIWNWQSRSVIAVLTGHNHYVMSAAFHPKEDLVVTASLDQTVRVWDTSSLRGKSVSVGGDDDFASGGGHHGADKPTADVFGTTEVMVKYVLEGHERGANWAVFHPTQPLVVSGADDRLIKLWRYNDTKAWEVDTLRGHMNNVSCCLFHPKKDLILSNSEDRTIRVWDMTKRTGIHTFRRENDRFWVLTAHRNSNLVAVGHDAGLVVFKLDCERPLAMAGGSGHLYMVQDRDVQVVDMEKNNKSFQLGNCRQPTNAMTTGMKSLQHNMHNSTESNVLVYYTQDSGCYDLMVGPSAQSLSNDARVSARQGAANAVAFTARNRFAVLQSNGSIGIYNLENELSKKFEPPVTTDNLFPGGNNRVILKSEEKLVMYDLTARKVVEEAIVQGGVRYYSWSVKGDYVAFMSKHNVLLAGKDMQYCHSFHENIRVKSGAWDENGVFVYATQSHVKYCLPNGDKGIIHSLAAPIYIYKVSRQFIYYVDREHQVHKERLNCTEYMFKLSLHKRNFQDVKMWITNGRLCGNAVIGYLKGKGFPEVALQFVENQQTRFNLALEYGHIEEAMVAAQEIDDPACWSRLGTDALRQGNQQIVEMVYQKMKSFDSLSFLYLITGNATKLRKMLKIAEMRNDIQSRFHNSLMLGSAEERVKIMAEMGQVPLAAMTAKAHNLTDYLERMEDQLQGLDVSAHIPAGARLLAPPPPLCRPAAGDTANWPLLRSVKEILEKTSFENVQASAQDNVFGEANENPEDTAGDGMGWDDGDMSPGGAIDIDAGEWGGDIGDLDLDLDAAVEAAPQEQGVTIALGESLQSKWKRRRALPADLVAAGEFEEALGLLKRRLGVINADPLEPLFKEAYWATCSSAPALPQMPAISWPLLSEGNAKARDIAPVIHFSSRVIAEKVKEGQKLTTQGKFSEGLVNFRAALQAIPLSAAADAQEEKNLMEMIDVCREYVNFTRLEGERKKLDPAAQVARNVEMAAYLTCVKVQSKTHQCLALQLAMFTSFKNGNFITSASFAKRLLQGSWGDQGAAILPKAKQILANCEKNASDKHNINFDARASVEDVRLCSGTYTQIMPTDAVAKCPYCGSTYHASQKGKLCSTCGISEIGANTLGIQLRPL